MMSSTMSTAPHWVYKIPSAIPSLTHTHTHTHTHIHTVTHTHTHKIMYIHIHTHVCNHVCVYTHTPSRLIGFGKNKYTVMDIQGLSVAKWRERQRTRQASKTKAGHSRTSSLTASVHYSSTGDSVVIGMDNSNQR